MAKNILFAFALMVHVAVMFVFQVGYAYTRGFWFLLWHPIKFTAFVDEWKKFEQRIEDADDWRFSEQTTTRRQRRNAGFPRMSRRIQCFLIEPTGKSITRPYELEGGHKGTSEIPLYRRADTGDEFTLRDAPAGAIYRATWYEDSDAKDIMLTGFDGQSWCVKMPDGHTWAIDSRASNCGSPNDMNHRCWIRHGTAPNFTVDKAGPTCSAGAGSIIVPGFHGYLRNGWLEECP